MKKQNNSNNPAHLYEEGLKFYNGYKVGNQTILRNYASAVVLFESAAGKDHIGAHYMLGLCYLHGHGVVQNAQRAVDLFRKAALADHVGAQVSLGFCHLFGKGAPQASQEAVAWFRKAEQEGSALALHNLAYCYLRGDGVRQNIGTAQYLYQKAGEKGFASAYCNVGTILVHQENFTEDAFVRAAKWYALAHARGDEKASTSFTQICQKNIQDLATRSRIMDVFLELLQPQPKRTLTSPAAIISQNAL